MCLVQLTNPEHLGATLFNVLNSKPVFLFTHHPYTSGHRWLTHTSGHSTCLLAQTVVWGALQMSLFQKMVLHCQGERMKTSRSTLLVYECERERNKIK